MKCPKCGYVSFDHNDICPKCSKSIGAERDRLDLPSYRPTPPFLLGSLTGQSRDADATDLMSTPEGTQILDQEFEFSDEGLEFDSEELETVEAPEPSFDDTYRLEVQPETAPEEKTQDVPELAEEIQEVDLSITGDDEAETINLDDLAIDDSESGFSPDEPEPSSTDETVLDPGLSLSEDTGTGGTSAMESPEMDFEDTITLDDLTEAEPQDTPGEQEIEGPVEMDETMPLDIDDYTQDEPEITLEEQEIDIPIEMDGLAPLDLDDQTQGEQDIEIPIEMDETVSLDIDDQMQDEPEIVLEEEGGEEPVDLDKTVALNLESLMQGDAGDMLSEQEIEIPVEPDISIPIIENGVGGVEEPGLLTLDDLEASEFAGEPASIEDTAKTSRFDQEIDIDLEEDTLSTEDISISDETISSDEDFPLDLDALELELELEPEK